MFDRLFLGQGVVVLVRFAGDVRGGRPPALPFRRAGVISRLWFLSNLNLWRFTPWRQRRSLSLTERRALSVNSLMRFEQNLPACQHFGRQAGRRPKKIS